MTANNVTRASLMLEIDGRICVAVLTGIDLNLMTGAIANMTEEKVLRVVKLDDSREGKS